MSEPRVGTEQRFTLYELGTLTARSRLRRRCPCGQGRASPQAAFACWAPGCVRSSSIKRPWNPPGLERMIISGRAHGSGAPLTLNSRTLGTVRSVDVRHLVVEPKHGNVQEHSRGRRRNGQRSPGARTSGPSCAELGATLTVTDVMTVPPHARHYLPPALEEDIVRERRQQLARVAKCGRRSSRVEAPGWSACNGSHPGGSTLEP